MKTEQLTDSCEMPFGKHLGTQMEDVPASYLLYIWGEHKEKYQAGKIPESKPLFRVMFYIEDNLQGLNQEFEKSLKRKA